MRRAPVVIALSLLLLFMGRGVLDLSPVERAAAPYLYDLLTWEVTHLPNKWVHKLWSFLPWNSKSQQERLEDLQRYFQIGKEIRELESEMAQLYVGPPHGTGNPGAVENEDEGSRINRELDGLRRARSAIRSGVEETLESEVSTVLVSEGLSSRIGLIFPPVDVALTGPPRVLVISPRDRIERVKTLLLRSDMSIEEMEELERKIFQEQDLAALVQGIGGVATYPTIVRSGSSLRHAAITSAHEWLHTYWFFRAMGWNMFTSPQMNTLNETAATVAGVEIGKRVYEAITGQKIQEPPPSGPSTIGEAVPPRGVEEVFNFDREMRKTRRRAGELLGEGKIEEAEAYMEERRKLFVDNGFHIRKLNQAYFAFRGTYATSPASVSPIGAEVERVWRASGSVGEFIRTMARFGSYQEFLEHLSGLPEEPEGAKVRDDREPARTHNSP